MEEHNSPRINRCIQLLESGQPIYYTSIPSEELTFESGKAHASTWADFLMADFEHNPFDTAGLLQFMRGLVAGGPTRSGHRTPTVIATLPSNCRTVNEVRANAWQIRQVLSCGVHGILHTHARQTEAVRAFVEECRYPFQKVGLGGGLQQGQRGAGGQRIPAEIWGTSPVHYIQIADPWPLNPKGELMLGLKLEDKECAANAEYICKVPGLTFTEWGPGDMGMSFGYEDAHDPPYPPEMDAVRANIQKACEDNGIRFLSSWKDPSQTDEENLQKMIDLKINIVSGATEAQANIGRRMTGRKMPW